MRVRKGSTIQGGVDEAAATAHGYAILKKVAEKVTARAKRSVGGLGTQAPTSVDPKQVRDYVDGALAALSDADVAAWEQNFGAKAGKRAQSPRARLGERLTTESIKAIERTNTQIAELTEEERREAAKFEPQGFSGNAAFYATNGLLVLLAAQIAKSVIQRKAFGPAVLAVALASAIPADALVSTQHAAGDNLVSASWVGAKNALLHHVDGHNAGDASIRENGGFFAKLYAPILGVVAVLPGISPLYRTLITSTVGIAFFEASVLHRLVHKRAAVCPKWMPKKVFDTLVERHDTHHDNLETDRFADVPYGLFNTVDHKRLNTQRFGYYASLDNLFRKITGSPSRRLIENPNLMLKKHWALFLREPEVIRGIKEISVKWSPQLVEPWLNDIREQKPELTQTPGYQELARAMAYYQDPRGIPQDEWAGFLNDSYRVNNLKERGGQKSPALVESWLKEVREKQPQLTESPGYQELTEGFEAA